MASRSRSRPPVLNRDHARPRTAPAPSMAAVEARLAELVTPATFALTAAYHQLGLRARTLTLPIMTALVLAMVGLQIPAVSTLAAMVARDPVLWAPPLRVSQQALSQRFRCFPAALFAELVQTLLPPALGGLARAVARCRPVPLVVTQVQRHFPRIWIVDATTREALFRKVGLLRDQPETTLGGKLLAVLDRPSKLPVHRWRDEEANANEKRFLDQLKAVLTAGTLLILDAGFYAFPFFDWLTRLRRAAGSLPAPAPWPRRPSRRSWSTPRPSGTVSSNSASIGPIPASIPSG